MAMPEPQDWALALAQAALDIHRDSLRETLDRIAVSRIVITSPQKLTPFCFPIKVDSLRDTMTSEKLEDRIKKLITVND